MLASKKRFDGYGARMSKMAGSKRYLRNGILQQVAIQATNISNNNK